MVGNVAGTRGGAVSALAVRRPRNYVCRVYAGDTTQIHITGGVVARNFAVTAGGVVSALAV